MVNGISQTVSLHPDRLEAKREQVKTWLKELSTDFHQNIGGCWSFLDAGIQANGVRWTDSHQSIEELFILATALKLATPSPRIIWPYLPAGMPYYSINVE